MAYAEAIGVRYAPRPNPVLIGLILAAFSGAVSGLVAGLAIGVLL